MVIEGEAPVVVLSSKKGINAASNSKKPFAFIERTWEVKNPTEEDVSLCDECVSGTNCGGSPYWSRFVAIGRVVGTAFCIFPTRDP